MPGAAPPTTVAPSASLTSQQLSTLPSDTLTQSWVVPGSRVTLSHQGFTPGETVDAGIVDGTRVLASTTADGTGRASTDVVLSAPQGSTIDLFMIGRSSGFGAKQRISVVGNLVATGHDNTTTTNVALGLLVAGILVIARSRRRFG